MGLPSALILVASAFAISQHLPISLAAPSSDTDLFLTPLIKSGDLDKARELSMDSMKLSHIESEKNVISYSGYITIDESKHSNLFFWFFPAEDKPETAPLILWINELPGFTCLKGVFLETGPFYVDDDNKLKSRNTSWAKTHSMLYIDAPVGTGFSFADSEDAYANNSEEEADELYEALTQFFTLFKEFKTNDFYLAGESYAGTTIPDFAKRIDDENDKSSAKINLKGFIMGAPFLDLSQVHKEDYYYSIGLISAKQRKEFQAAHDKFYELHKAGKDTEAVQYGISLHVGPEALTAKMTGFVDTHSALTTVDPPELGKFIKFVDSKEAHRYLHTGVHKFISTNKVVFKHFGSDLFRKHTKTLEELLNRGHRVLIYVGQFDIAIPHDKIEDVIFNLKWDKAADFVAAPRNIWRVNGEVAGYVQSTGSLTYALVRNAGNYAIQDQPEWTTDLVEKFIAGKDF